MDHPRQNQAVDDQRAALHPLLGSAGRRTGLREQEPSTPTKTFVLVIVRRGTLNFVKVLSWKLKTKVPDELSRGFGVSRNRC